MRESRIARETAGSPSRYGLAREASVAVAPPANEGTRIAGEWADVHVREVEVARSAGSGGPYVDVRADVFLGRLLPADVKVELVAAMPSASGDRFVPRRLWSLFSYHNCSYAFGTRVPQRLLDRPEGCAVRVKPAAELPPGVRLAPIVAPLARLDMAAVP